MDYGPVEAIMDNYVPVVSAIAVAYCFVRFAPRKRLAAMAATARAAAIAVYAACGVLIAAGAVFAGYNVEFPQTNIAYGPDYTRYRFN